MSAVVPDFDQALVADVLVPVLARPASPVVQVLDETAVGVEPVLIAASAAATETVVTAVVSGPAVSVYHVWSVQRDRLLQISSTFIASLALRLMPYVAGSLAHFIAVARCDTQTFPPLIPMTRAGPGIVFHLTHLPMCFNQCSFNKYASSFCLVEETSGNL